LEVLNSLVIFGFTDANDEAMGYLN